MGNRPYKEAERKTFRGKRSNTLASSEPCAVHIILRVTLRVVKNNSWGCRMGKAGIIQVSN